MHTTTATNRPDGLPAAHRRGGRSSEVSPEITVEAYLSVTLVRDKRGKNGYIYLYSL
jgi:hypothetical protein